MKQNEGEREGAKIDLVQSLITIVLCMRILRERKKEKQEEIEYHSLSGPLFPVLSPSYFRSFCPVYFSSRMACLTLGLASLVADARLRLAAQEREEKNKDREKKRGREKEGGLGTKGKEIYRPQYTET